MKRLLALTLTAVLIFTLLPLSVFAENTGYSVAAAIAAQALYWLYVILIPFSGLQWLPGAASLLASALTVVFVIVFYLMKNYEKMKRKRQIM